MRFFLSVGVFFCLICGLLGIKQAKEQAAAKENGVYDDMLVKEKIKDSRGGRQLKVLYRQKTYWVHVTPLTFDSVHCNGQVVLKYDLENNIVIEEAAAAVDYISGPALILAAVICSVQIFKTRKN